MYTESSITTYSTYYPFRQPSILKFTKPSTVHITHPGNQTELHTESDMTTIAIHAAVYTALSQHGSHPCLYCLSRRHEHAPPPPLSKRICTVLKRKHIFHPVFFSGKKNATSISYELRLLFVVFVFSFIPVSCMDVRVFCCCPRPVVDWIGLD